MNNVIYFYDFNAFAKYYQDPFIANLIKNEEFCKQFVKTLWIWQTIILIKTW